MLKSPSGCSKRRVQKKRIPIEKLLIPFSSIMRNKGEGETLRGPVLLGLFNVEHMAPSSRPHQMILCWVTRRLSPSVTKATIPFQQNEWPSQFKGFPLRWRQQKATEMDLAASQALYQWLCFWGNMRGWTAVPSQLDSEWEGLELMLNPSCSAELWICEWAMYCGEDSRDGVEEAPVCSTFRLRHTVKVLNGDSLYLSHICQVLCLITSHHFQLVIS